jgi:DNA polymerase-3 subunit gamma/tau
LSYVVLARKYRPQTFANLVGQEPVVRTLRNAMAMGRVHHAFLLTGARGVGKTTTARLLARGLNCAEGPTTNPCGTCPHCQSMQAGNAPDVIEVDGASNTGVDYVRELREAARYMPSLGRYKLYIIDEVHMLSQAAFNALLKTLEEPPPHIKFIFATTEPAKIPVTILSRCQRFDLRRVDLPLMLAHLGHICRQEGIEASEAALTTIAREAQGSVRDALSLLDQVLSYAGERPIDEVVLEALGTIDRDVLFTLLDSMVQRDAAQVLGQVQDLANRGHDLGEVMSLLLQHIRDVSVAAAMADPQGALPERTPHEVERLKLQAQKRSQTDWHRLFMKGCEVVEDVVQSSMPQMALEMGLLRLLHIAPAADLENLLERLDQLLTTTPVDPSPPSAGRRPGAGSAPAASAASAPSPGASPAASPAAPPAPQRAPAPAPEPVTEAVGGLGWRSFVDRVRTRRPDLASVLEQGLLVSFAPTGVQVAYTPGTFFWEAANDKEHRALFAELLAEHMGQDAVPFGVIAQEAGELPGAMPSLAAQRQEQQQSAWQQTEQKAREHAHVQAAMQIFGGEVRAIEPADGEGG